MRTKNVFIPVLLSGFIISLFLSPDLTALNKNQEQQPQKTKPTIIPKQVKVVFEEGMKTQEPRLDIPFTVAEHIYLPSPSQNLYTIFLFKVKNEDLGYSPIERPGEGQEKKKEGGKEEVQPASVSAPTRLQASSSLFIQLNKLENGSPGELVSEVYIPIRIETDSGSYEPDKEEIYSTGYPFPPGHYLASIAIASKDLENIGTQYLELSLPDAAAMTDRLDTTSLFFYKNMEEMSSPETKITVHKGFFVYSILKFEPNLERAYSFGDTMEVFFYIYGAQPVEGQNFNIEINYKVLKGEDVEINWAPQIYTSLLIHQPLPLKKTVLITSTTKDGQTTEKKEKRQIEPGSYTLSMTITDKVSGKSIVKTSDFVVK
jgi:hypothetical protein